MPARNIGSEGSEDDGPGPPCFNVSAGAIALVVVIVAVVVYFVFVRK